MTVLDESARPEAGTALSTAMRQGSLAEHQQAEESPFMSELMAGRVNEQGYADLLLRLRVVYSTMEPILHERADDPIVAAVNDTALDRLATIDADLEHWCPDGTRTVDSPAAEAYRARLLEASEWGGYLIAHHYTRYLGDLSGGQAIGRILDRTFGLDGAGISFYEFPGIEKPKVYKDGYRARLDALPLSAEDQARVIEEVKVAFHLNQAMFVELGKNLESYAR